MFYKIPKSKYRKLKYEDSKIPKIKSTLDEIDALWDLEQIPGEANKFFDILDTKASLKTLNLDTVQLI